MRTFTVLLAFPIKLQIKSHTKRTQETEKREAKRTTDALTQLQFTIQKITFQKKFLCFHLFSINFNVISVRVFFFLFSIRLMRLLFLLFSPHHSIYTCVHHYLPHSPTPTSRSGSHPFFFRLFDLSFLF